VAIAAPQVATAHVPTAHVPTVALLALKFSIADP